MKTFVIKHIYWNPPPPGNTLQRCPNSLQIPEKNVVYSLTSNRPKKEWKVMEDGTLHKIHDSRVNAVVHNLNGEWFWTPQNGLMGSFRSWESLKIDIVED